MKKTLALLLALVLCIGMIPFGTAVMAEDAPAETVITAAKTLSLIALDWTVVDDVTFNTPIDCSGSDGTIKIVTSLDGNTHDNLWYYLWIKTANKESNRYYYMYADANQTKVISLSDLGLTDDDLKNVTGYKINPGVRNNNADFTYAISVPKSTSQAEDPTPTETDAENILAENKELNLTAMNWSVVDDVTFKTPIDCSGSEGRIVVTTALNGDSYANLWYYLWIKTANKESNRYFFSYDDTASTVSLTLRELGLTDEDLKKVTGYKINPGVRSHDATFTYSITIPKYVEKPAEPLKPGVLIDFDNRTNITLDSNISLNMPGGSSNGTFSANLTQEVVNEISFVEPVALESNTLALDVTGVYRTDSITMTLMDGETELGQAAVQLYNNSVDLFSGSNPFGDRTSAHTFFFHFEDLTADTASHVTGLKLYAATYGDANPEIDNLRMVEKTEESDYLADFESVYNIKSYTNLTALDAADSPNGTDAAMFKNEHPAQSQGYSWTAIVFNSAVTIDNTHFAMKATNLRTDNGVWIRFFKGDTEITNIFVYPTRVYGDYGTEYIYNITEKFSEDVIGQDFTAIIIGQSGWYATNKMIIDNLRIGSEFEVFATEPKMNGGIIEDANNAYLNGKLGVSASITADSLTKTISNDGYTLSEMGVIVAPVAALQGEELTVDSEAAAIAISDLESATFTTVLFNENDYSDTQMAFRAYAIWTDGSEEVVLYTPTKFTDGVAAPAVTDDVIMGDANGDGNVDIRDLIRVKKYLAETTEVVFWQADVDADNTVGDNDLVVYRKYLLGCGDIADAPYTGADVELIADWDF